MNLETNDTDLHRRAALFAALGDAHRLAIVEHVALTDCSPSELEARLGLRSNLLAHHLDILGSAGIIERVRSAGDGRRRYVKLRPRALAELWRSPLVVATRVLFACRYNSARSQFAAAYWNARSPVRAESAGAQPADAVHPEALRTAAQRGLGLRDAAPKGYDAIESAPDLVVTVCDVAFEADPPFPASLRLHWSVPDPAEEGSPEAFDRAFDEIVERIDLLLPVVTLHPEFSPHPPSP